MTSRLTVSALIQVLYDWSRALDEGHEVCVGFFDIKKAFDTVPHVLLLEHLQTLNLYYLKKHASHGMNLMNLKVVWMVVVSLKLNLVSLLFGHSYTFNIFNVFESSNNTIRFHIFSQWPHLPLSWIECNYNRWDKLNFTIAIAYKKEVFFNLLLYVAKVYWSNIQQNTNYQNAGSCWLSYTHHKQYFPGRLSFLSFPHGPVARLIILHMTENS